MRLAVVSLVFLVACGGQHAAKDFGGTYDGNGSYTATVSGSASGLVGATARHVIIDDDGSAKGSTMTIEVAQGCALAADYTYVHANHPVVTSASASIVPGQTCQLPIEGGTGVFTVTTGHAVISGGSALDLTLAGTVTSWAGAQTQGNISVTFRAAGG